QTLNPKPQTLHPAPCTLHPKPSTLNPNPGTPRPTTASSTCHDPQVWLLQVPKTQTLHSTLHPTPSRPLGVAPAALKPQPYTLPYTPHPHDPRVSLLQFPKP
ncbi:hypothetical protein T484DRAFT_1650844, partial [Baffinella frigidus]